MSVSELLPLLTGATGALVLSLVGLYAFWRGLLLNPRKTVRREDYEALLTITERNTKAIERLATRRTR